MEIRSCAASSCRVVDAEGVGAVKAAEGMVEELQNGCCWCSIIAVLLQRWGGATAAASQTAPLGSTNLAAPATVVEGGETPPSLPSTQPLTSIPPPPSRQVSCCDVNAVPGRVGPNAVRSKSPRSLAQAPVAPSTSTIPPLYSRSALSLPLQVSPSATGRIESLR